MSIEKYWAVAILRRQLEGRAESLCDANRSRILLGDHAHDRRPTQVLVHVLHRSSREMDAAAVVQTQALGYAGCQQTSATPAVHRVYSSARSDFVPEHGSGFTQNLPSLQHWQGE